MILSEGVVPLLVQDIRVVGFRKIGLLERELTRYLERESTTSPVKEST